MAQNVINYMQTDPRWSSTDYSAPGEKTTIGKAGCGPACMAMVIATWADRSVTPMDTVKWSLSHGYKACKQGTYYSYFTPQGKAYGLTVTQLNGANLYNYSIHSPTAKPHHDKALQAVKSGDMVIACMGKGRWTKSGHFILLYNTDGTNYYINDPNSTRADRIKAKIADVQEEVKYYFICKAPTKPEPEKEEDDMTQEKFNEMFEAAMNEYMKEMEKQQVSEWAAVEWDKAKSDGLFDGSRPQAPLARQEAAIILDRLKEGRQ